MNGFGNFVDREETKVNDEEMKPLSRAQMMEYTVHLFWIPSLFTVLVDEMKYVTYKLSCLQRIFLTMQDSSSSFAAEIYGIIMTLTILLNVGSVIAASLPQYQFSPTTCLNPACSNDPYLCPNTEICAPKSIPVFRMIDFVCAIIYMVDFGTRLLLCGIMPTRLSGAISANWDEQEVAKAKRQHRIRMDEPYYSFPKQVFWFIFSIHSFIDIATILPPFLITYAFGSRAQETRIAVSYLRLSRLLRLFRIFRLNQTTRLNTSLLYNTLRKSKEAIGILVIYGIILIILFASLMEILEGGIFIVNGDYPNGAFLRVNQFGEYNLTPFISVPVSMYFTVVTLTTVGYGDIVPVTVAGQAVACICAIFSVLVIALPVSIIGSNFAAEYNHYVQQLKQHRNFRNLKKKALRDLWMNGKKIPTQTDLLRRSSSSDPSKLIKSTAANKISLKRAVSASDIILPSSSRYDNDGVLDALPIRSISFNVVRQPSGFTRVNDGHRPVPIPPPDNNHHTSKIAKCWFSLLGSRSPMEIGIYGEDLDAVDHDGNELKAIENTPLSDVHHLRSHDIKLMSRDELENMIHIMNKEYYDLQEKYHNTKEILSAVESLISSSKQ